MIVKRANELYDPRYYPRPIDEKIVRSVLDAFADVAMEGLLCDNKVIIPNLGTINIHEAKIPEHYEDTGYGYQHVSARTEKRGTFRLSLYTKECLRRGSL
jgi:hypothetical protein